MRASYGPECLAPVDTLVCHEIRALARINPMGPCSSGNTYRRRIRGRRRRERRELHVSPGTTFGLIGPNGAGKTTTARMIVGIFAPDGGGITWRGQAINRRTRRRFGYLPEERGLYAKMPVRDHIRYFGQLHGLTNEQSDASAERWIAAARLGQVFQARVWRTLERQPAEGQVACTLVHAPEVLVLDEPFSGLDPVNAQMLLGVFRELKTQGVTMILSSHQMWQLEDLCSSFCIISDGTNRATGTLDELRANWPTPESFASLRRRLARARCSIVWQVPVNCRFLNGVLEYVVPVETTFSDVLRTLVEADAIHAFRERRPIVRRYLHRRRRGRKSVSDFITVFKAEFLRRIRSRPFVAGLGARSGGHRALHQGAAVDGDIDARRNAECGRFRQAADKGVGSDLTGARF